MNIEAELELESLTCLLTESGADPLPLIFLMRLRHPRHRELSLGPIPFREHLDSKGGTAE